MLSTTAAPKTHHVRTTGLTHNATITSQTVGEVITEKRNVYGQYLQIAQMFCVLFYHIHNDCQQFGKQSQENAH